MLLHDGSLSPGQGNSRLLLNSQIHSVKHNTTHGQSVCLTLIKRQGTCLKGLVPLSRKQLTTCMPAACVAISITAFQQSHDTECVKMLLDSQSQHSQTLTGRCKETATARWWYRPESNLSFSESGVVTVVEKQARLNTGKQELHVWNNHVSQILWEIVKTAEYCLSNVS